MAAALTALALAALVPTDARAATISGSTTAAGATVTFTPGAGEANDVTVNQVGTRLSIRDSGAPLVARGECTMVEPDRAECPLPSREDQFLVFLGDGDDRGVSDHSIELGGGPGNDTLTAAGDDPLLDGDDGDDVLVGRDLRGDDGDDRLSIVSSIGSGVADGGAGNDVLIGSAGDDFLDGGGGADRLEARGGDDNLTDGDSDAGADADVLDGGAGFDALSYERRRAAVSIDLSDPAPDGAAGEADRISSIERIGGGAGADVLIGTDGSDELSGNGGHDRLDGRGGDDALLDTSGGVTADGGAGDDRLVGERAERVTLNGGDGDDDLVTDAPWARLSCGAGADSVVVAPLRRLIPPDCETAGVGLIVEAGSGRLTGRTLTFRARRRTDATGVRTARVFEIRLDRVSAPAPSGADEPGRLGRFRVGNVPRDPTRTVTITLRLTRSAARAVRRSGRARLATYYDAGPDVYVLRFR